MKFAGICFLVVFAVSAFIWILTSEPETAPEMLAEENWPVTVEEAVNDLLPRLPFSERIIIKFSEKRAYSISTHFSVGMWIRNQYGLWRSNDKLILSACGHPCHPDEASAKIVEALWQELHK